MSRLRTSLLAALIAGAVPATAQPALESVSVEARIEAGHPASISMSYVLRPGQAPAVGFTALRFGDARVANVRAFLGGRELSFRTAASSDSRVDGQVDLPEAAVGTERIRLRLVYEVFPEVDPAPRLFTLTLPLLVVEWPPAEARPQTFQAIVHLPAGVTAHAAFPSEFARIDAVERTSPGRAYRFDLPVVPALIRLRAGTGRTPLLTAERAVDAAAIGLFILLGAVGWRRLRETLK